MSDPAQRNDLPATAGGGIDPESTIAQLLLSGLAHYVAGRCERAVDVWTRVLFLDRNHPKARAYIRRARATMAERLRESEALLHAGVEACDRGEAAEARALLTQAIQRGGTNDEVLAVLDRVERLGVVPAEVAGPEVRSRHRRARLRRDAETVPAPRRSRASSWRLATLGLGLALVGLYVVGTRTPAGSHSDGRGAQSGTPTSTGVAAPLPVPSLPALAILEAEWLAQEGRLVEALGVLAAVGRGGGLHQEVEALRGRLQRRVLEESALSLGGTGRVVRVPARGLAP